MRTSDTCEKGGRKFQDSLSNPVDPSVSQRQPVLVAEGKQVQGCGNPWGKVRILRSGRIKERLSHVSVYPVTRNEGSMTCTSIRRSTHPMNTFLAGDSAKRRNARSLFSSRSRCALSTLVERRAFQMQLFCHCFSQRPSGRRRLCSLVRASAFLFMAMLCLDLMIPLTQ